MPLSRVACRLLPPALCLAAWAAPAARGAATITFTQSGGNVVATGGGTVNLAALTFFTGLMAGPEVSPAKAVAIVGSGVDGSTYRGISGPTSFGSGASKIATSQTGDFFGVIGASGFFGSNPLIVVPTGYTSLTPLAANDTWTGQTFASLGMTPGTYTWTWGNGATADSLTVNIGSAAVPEPGWAALAVVAAVGAAGARWRRRGAAGRG